MASLRWLKKLLCVFYPTYHEQLCTCGHMSDKWANLILRMIYFLINTSGNNCGKFGYPRSWLWDKSLSENGLFDSLFKKAPLGWVENWDRWGMKCNTWLIMEQVTTVSIDLFWVLLVESVWVQLKTVPSEEAEVFIYHFYFCNYLRVAPGYLFSPWHHVLPHVKASKSRLSEKPWLIGSCSRKAKS